jgi:hypothetical protein
MKKTLTVGAALLALLCALAFSLIHAPAGHAASPAPPALAAAPPAEHPNYRDAIAELRSARKHLGGAEEDGYGHRTRAMQAIDDAIHECNEAVRILH